MNKFHDILENQLTVEGRFITDDGELKKFVIIDAAFNMDKVLIKLLLTKPELKQKFFTEIAGHWVFDTNLFVRYMENKNFLKDSYTRYRNKIGLTIDGKFMKQLNDVSLVWPFKDCILEGGQSREDQKRPEIFFNEILAQEEIDQLTEPKVLTKWRRYTVDGEQKVAELKRDKSGTIKENLIIKGNNLLALYSLLPQFEEQVKLIYIDPPYNTGNDSFQYNDSFNHSTWLTFMKNRLEVARRLLRKDGVIFVQCDDNEQAYLKVLLDEIFYPTNFVETFIWKNTDNAPTLSKKTRKNVEYIHCYEKSLNFQIAYVGRKSDNDDAPLLNIGNPIAVLEFIPGIIKFKISDNTYKEGKYNSIELLNDLIVENGINKNKIKLKGKFKWQQSFLENEISKGTYFLIKSEKMSIRYQRKVASNIAPNKFVDDIYLSKAIGIETNEDSKKHIDSLDLKFSSFPKPETLIAFLIKAVTQRKDIILDYHLGSGTTAAVAHKMNRQYIGIEQMDYIETVAVKRLKKVIGEYKEVSNLERGKEEPKQQVLEFVAEKDDKYKVLDFDEGGISKAVKWQGGGDFVYCELKKYNQTFIEQIEEASSTARLLEIWEEMKNHSFLNYNVDIKKHDEHIEDFKKLDIKIKKEHLLELLNKNQLYVNLSSIDDQDYKVSTEDKKLTNEFYEIEKEQEIVQTKADL